MNTIFPCIRTQRFTAKVTHNSAISCSDDTRVAVCTEDGVYILAMQCDQVHASSNVVLHTSKISPHTKVKTFNVDVPRLRLERELPRTDNHQLMFDRTISPLMQTNQSMTGFRASAWSPLGGDSLGCCVIATLSYDHRLCIHKFQDGQAWTKVVELSRKFHDHVKDDDFRLVKDRINETTTERTILMEKMKWRTYCLAAVAMTWSPVYTQTPGGKMIDRENESPVDECSRFSILAVAMKSGHVVLWKVTFPVLSECCQVEHLIDTGSEIPMTLCWARLNYHTSVLAVATLNGQLKLYMVGESKEQTADQGKDKYMDQSKDKSMDQSKDKSMDQGKDMSTDQGKDNTSMDQEQTRKQCWDSDSDTEETLTKETVDRDGNTQKDPSGPKHQTSSQFTVTELGPLWSECDDMVIRNMCWSRQKNVLFASKGPFLLRFDMSLDNSVPHSSVAGPEVKLKAHPPQLIGDKRGISALWLDRTKLFLSMTSGHICCMNIEQDNNPSIDVVNIQWETTDETDSYNSEPYQSLGMCGTPGGIYLFLAESPSVEYCHLTLIEPLKVTLVLRGDTDVASVLLKHNETLSEFTDALAHLKFILAQKQPLPETLARLTTDKSVWPEMSLGRLKLVRFLLQVLKLGYIESDVTSQDVLEMEKLIMKSHLEMALKKLVRRKTVSLSDAERCSLKLACDWLGSCHGTKETQALIQKVTTRLTHSSDGTDNCEKCKICQADSPFSSFRNDSCQNRHGFARCCQTLLLCSVAPYRTCSSCGALAIGRQISGSSWFEGVVSNSCTFCDGRLLYSM